MGEAMQDNEVMVENAGDDNYDTDDSVADLAGKYLTFALGDEVYGIEILKVVEIIGIMHITSVPCASDYLKGVINLRGKIIPLVDLRLKFGMPELAYGEKTCIIVVNVPLHDKQVSVGMIVDTVLEVRDFDTKSLSAAPEFGAVAEGGFVVAMGRTNSDTVVILIDVDRALGREEIEQVAAVSESATV